MQHNKLITNGLYAVLVLLILIGGLTVRAHQLNRRPNNQYELLCYPDHYVLKDGRRTVDTIKAGQDKVLDSLIEQDNR